MSVQIGDKVMYVPDKAHAQDVLADGTFAWSFESTSKREAGKELPNNEVVMLLCRKDNKASSSRPAAIKPLAPRCCWPAKVLAVGEDGKTLDLEVEGRPPGCTFGMAKVPHAPREKNVPHTWHEDHPHA